MNNTSREPTLALSGTGKVGRRVVERLTARGLPVRIGSRSGKPRFDWDDPLDLGPSSGRGRIGLRLPLPGRDSRRRADADLFAELAEPFVDAGDIADVAVAALTDDRHVGGVQRALGREPRDFSDYARDAAATGTWNPRTTRVA